VRIFQHHVVLPHNTLHGGALLGAFVLMVTVSLSAGISWATYASDYSRYMKPTSSKAAIFWLTLAGLTASYVWVETIGLAGASVLSNQTAAGVRTLMGGGVLGVLALIAIVFGAITSNSMNDYTGSLAFQALGARIRRPVIAAIVAVLAFAAILWHYEKDRYTPAFLRRALVFGNLKGGWPALVAFVVGFGAMVPFMNTSIIVGPVATALKGADLAFYVGFVVAGVLYYVLRRVAQPSYELDASVRAVADDPA
jgi:NCS1 family nucleobase:cation symporter-1